MPHTSRRHFLKLAITAAAGLPFATRWFAGHAAERALAVSRTLFPQSVASGDPRPDRVLLWTRAPADDASVTVRLQVEDDAQFTRLRVERELGALAEHDHCLRVRVEGLQPGQRYHYRFLRLQAGEWVSSPPGITRTAPAANAATGGLRFAFMSCQDFGGRWYNTLVPLLDQELDFILHLGDFIYESVGDASFQDVDAERSITLETALTSNVQTAASPSIAEHQIHALLAAGVPVTLNTDNPTTSHTQLSCEYRRGGVEAGLSAATLDLLARNAARASFTQAGRLLADF